jgi:hypothetical protein
MVTIVTMGRLMAKSEMTMGYDLGTSAGVDTVTGVPGVMP